MRIFPTELKIKRRRVEGEIQRIFSCLGGVNFQKIAVEMGRDFAD